MTRISGQALNDDGTRQHGAAAVEFAFVFPILFALIYAAIVYGYVFVVNESVHFAAKEAAESAVRVDPAIADYEQRVTRIVRATAVESLEWMPEGQRARVIGDEAGSKVQVQFETVESERALRVRLVFDVVAPRPLFPVVRLPLVGPVPPLPEHLRASAMVLI